MSTLISNTNKKRVKEQYVINGSIRHTVSEVEKRAVNKNEEIESPEYQIPNPH